MKFLKNLFASKKEKSEKKKQLTGGLKFLKFLGMILVQPL